MGLPTFVWAKVISSLVGDGIGGEVAGRASAYLVDEARKAIDREELPVSKVRLRPGETYTVLARPAPTRHERKLSRRREALLASERRVGRPTRRQLRIARDLRSAQRRVDRRRPGTRRHGRAVAREAVVGARFDRAMTPTRRQRSVRRDLERVTDQLDGIRERRFEAARARRGLTGRPPKVVVHDAASE